MACISRILLKQNKNDFTTNLRITEYTKLEETHQDHGVQMKCMLYWRTHLFWGDKYSKKDHMFTMREWLLSLPFLNFSLSALQTA